MDRKDGEFLPPTKDGWVSFAKFIMKYSSDLNCEIFYISSFKDDDPVFEVVDKFTVKNREEAVRYTEEYNKTHPDRTYYYRESRENRFGIIHEDRIVTYTSDICGNSEVDENIYQRIAKLRIKYRKVKKEYTEKRGILGHDSPTIIGMRDKMDGFVSKIGKLRKLSKNKLYRSYLSSKLSIKDWLEWWFRDKWRYLFTDIRFWFRRTFYFLKNHHDITETWGLDNHVLNDILWNVKRLRDDSETIPNEFVDEAIRELYGKSDSNFSLEDWLKNNKIDKDVDELATKKRNTVYDRLIRLVEMYKYYTFEIDDTDKCYSPVDMVDHYLPGTYQEYDYPKMHEEATKCWNEIFDLFKQHGRWMWD